MEKHAQLGSNHRSNASVILPAKRQHACDNCTCIFQSSLDSYSATNAAMLPYIRDVATKQDIVSRAYYIFQAGALPPLPHSSGHKRRVQGAAKAKSKAMKAEKGACTSNLKANLG